MQWRLFFPMAKFFLLIYDFFNRHRVALYSSMLAFFIGFAVLATRVSFQEDVMQFIPSSASTHNVTTVFSHLRVKDKIVVLFSRPDGDKEKLTAAADSFSSQLLRAAGGSLVTSVQAKAGGQQAQFFSSFVLSHLPIYLDTADYRRLDSLLSPVPLDAKLQQDFFALQMPQSLFTKDFIFADPLSLASPQLQLLHQLQLDGDYTIEDDRVYTSSGALLLFVDSKFPAGNTGGNGVLVDSIESLIAQSQQADAQLSVNYFGGPVIAVYNARQIRSDMMLTMGVAFLLITVVILLAFRNKFSLVLIFVPVLFGALFALAVLSFVQPSLSVIAVGAGSAIFGVVLSYSIHVVAHREHSASVRQLISEMAQPLTIGSFTTIGAFFSLVFTSSQVLRDFGWFSSLTIVGTTLFCLIYLPHLLSWSSVSAGPTPFLKAVERLNSFHLERSKVLVAVVFIVAIVGFFLSSKVQFSSDMNSLSYMPPKFEKVQAQLDSAFQKNYRNIYFVAVGKTDAEALANYKRMNACLDSLQGTGQVHQYSSAQSLLVPPDVQRRRIALWQAYFTPRKVAQIRQALQAQGAAYGFSPVSFEPFFAQLQATPSVVNFSAVSAFSDFMLRQDSLSMAISQVRLPAKAKYDVYNDFSSLPGVVILDKPHFLSQFVQSVSNDFYYVLFVSSFIVFLALLLSYGRFELALLTFMPMALSWFIILGLMALLGLQFNIVSVIIATFIFGTGDDFAIFISDGLLQEYRTGKPMLDAHKTAIFFSAFTTIAGMGALYFAKHPSLFSVAQISLIGMLSVVLIAYVVQPFLFNWFITRRTRAGRQPWTLVRFFAFLFYFCLFVVMALSLFVALPFLWVLGHKRRCRILHRISYFLMRGLFRVVHPYFRRLQFGSCLSSFQGHSLFIANHQSVVDLLLLMAFSPRVVFVMKGKVYHHFLFGPLVRAMGCVCISDGYEQMLPELKSLMADGYIPLIFPEGVRSVNGQLNRFHKGAFFLAQQLQADVVPLFITGAGNLIAKGDLFFLRPGLCTLTVGKPILYADSSWGADYRQRCHSVSRWYKAEYARLLSRFTSPADVFYTNRLFQNFIYKGPVLEWYMRVKVHMEHSYAVFNQLVPRKAVVTDIGCGYGFLDFMLTYLSPQRQVLGLDYDAEKVAVAQHCFDRPSSLQFQCSNASSVTLPLSDVFIMNDMLHYMDFPQQEALILQCMHRLNAGGTIIIRDGNSSNQRGQRITRLTEVLSTHILHFNKTEGQLHFTSWERICALALSQGFLISRRRPATSTSNEIFILQKPV